LAKQLPLALILLAAAIISAFKTTGSHPVPSKLSHELFITENTMWRGLVGLLFVAAAIGCFFVSARYAGDATTMYILIDLGCAALVGAAATQIPGVAAFFYSYIAVLVVTLGLNGFFMLAVSLVIASALSYFAYGRIETSYKA
jgi:hypothetical protein